METIKLEFSKWKSLLFALLVILGASVLVGLVIILVKAFTEGFKDTNHIVVIVGFALFFVCGWLCGQSRWWYALRNTWGHFMNRDSEDEDD